jgi:hypothetical protein
MVLLMPCLMAQYATCSTHDFCFQLILSSPDKKINRNEPAFNVSADRGVHKMETNPDSNAKTDDVNVTLRRDLSSECKTG